MSAILMTIGVSALSAVAMIHTTGRRTAYFIGLIQATVTIVIANAMK